MENPEPPKYSIRPYKPVDPDGAFPYSKQDLTPIDPSSDAGFYSVPRFVTHIDDNAIVQLKRYYDACLPRSQSAEGSSPTTKPSILDICSSWISHYPPRIATAASKVDGDMTVVGTGMNEAELAANPVLNPTPSGKARDGEQGVQRWWLQDLNSKPQLTLPPNVLSAKVDATTCVVSVDYLTAPVEVLESVRQHTKPKGTVHLVISNRCFPTKAVGRWLKVDEPKRLEMVGDYLWWGGWREIEIVEVVPPGSWLNDPLWVVRAVNTDAEAS